MRLNKFVSLCMTLVNRISLLFSVFFVTFKESFRMAFVFVPPLLIIWLLILMLIVLGVRKP